MLPSLIFTSNQPFSAVLDDIFSAISQPDIGQLFSKLAASTSYEEFTSLVQQAQGSVGLMRFQQLDLDAALALSSRQRWGNTAESTTKRRRL